MPARASGNGGNASFTGLFAGPRQSVYPAIWQSDNHRRKRPGARCPRARSGSNAPPAMTTETALRPPSLPKQREPRLAPWPIRSMILRDWEKVARRARLAPALRERTSLGERGRRRTRQDQISLGQEPVKLRTSGIRTERRKLVSSAGPVFVRALALSKGRSSRLT